MHVLLIHQAFASLDEPGGTRHHELARFFASKGHKVTVIASPISYLTGRSRDEHVHWISRENLDERVTILRVYTYPALHKSFVHRIFSFLSFMVSSFIIGLSVKDVDIVWGTSPPIFQGLTASLLATIKRVPFIFEVRDLWPAFAVAVGVLKNPFLIRASEWLERFLYHSAENIIVNSPGFISHVTEHGGLSITLIPNGADPAMFDPSNRGLRFRKQYHLENKFIVLYAGAHGLSNDLGNILKAANLLRKQPNIIFILVGDGKEKPHLVQKADEMRLPNILFLPPISKREIPEILAAADACIATLKPIEMYKTVYPNKVFDYMAAGRPVILAIDGVIKEIIEEANAGIPVPPGNPSSIANAVMQLNKDPNKATEMGIHGRQIIEARFSREKLAEEFLQVINSLV